MTDDHALDKIKKLLALASDPAASPQEAETAARQAAAMMAKYEIDEFDLMVSRGGSDWDLIEASAMGCRPGKKDAVVVPGWINIIAYGVRLWCNVRCSLRSGVVLFKGRRTDVEMAQWMHDTLVANCYAASKGKPNPGPYRNGYAAAIQARFKDMIKARDTDPLAAVVGSSGTSLVLVRSRLEEAMDLKWGEPGKTVSIKRALGSDGYTAGQGAHIPTNRPINGAGQLRLR